jgi:hypothetical protein
MSALRETLKSVRDVPHMLKVLAILQYKQILLWCTGAICIFFGY